MADIQNKIDYLKGSIDAADKCVQYMYTVMAMEQDETEEGVQ